MGYFGRLLGYLRAQLCMWRGGVALWVAVSVLPWMPSCDQPAHVSRTAPTNADWWRALRPSLGLDCVQRLMLRANASMGPIWLVALCSGQLVRSHMGVMCGVISGKPSRVDDTLHKLVGTPELGGTPWPVRNTWLLHI
jgi:hypothetical protein